MPDPEEQFSVAQRAEIELLSSVTRSDPARLAEFLRPDFVEIGRSGRRWTRREVLALLAEEQTRTEPRTAEWSLSDSASTKGPLSRRPPSRHPDAVR